MLPWRCFGTWNLLQLVTLKSKGGYSTNPETTYPRVCEDVYWQRDVKQVYIFSEKTGESLAGNVTAGRIIELSDGTHSVKEIVKTLMREFSGSPSEEEVLTFVTEFLSECEQKEFIELRSAPAEKVHEPLKEFTPAEVETLIEENATLVLDEKTSFDPTEDDRLMTYSLKEGRYLVLTDEEKEILMALLEEKPLQEVLSDVSESLGAKAKDIVTEFAAELLNHQLAVIQDEDE